MIFDVRMQVPVEARTLAGLEGIGTIFFSSSTGKIESGRRRPFPVLGRHGITGAQGRSRRR